MYMDKTNIFNESMRLILPSVLISILLYILLHELGHTIVLWSAGADITDFSILSAHVSYSGGHWTNISDRWLHLNGALFPLIIAVIYILLYRKEYDNRFYRVISGTFILMTIASLMAWIFIPILYTFGQAPESDDVYKFLHNFCYDYPAYLVSICAAILMFGYIYLAAQKGIFQNFRMTFKELKDKH